VGDHRQRRLGELIVNGVVDRAQVQRVEQQFAVHVQQQRDGVRLVLHGGQVQSGVLVLVALVEQVRVHGMQYLYGLRVAAHRGQMEGIAALVVAVQQRAPVQEQLHYFRVACGRNTTHCYDVRYFARFARGRVKNPGRTSVPCVTLLGRDVQRRQPFAVRLVDDERALLRVQQSFHDVVPSVPGPEMQRALAVMVLYVHARA